MTHSPRMAMVAGEASGDLLAGLLLEGMQRRWPQLAASGIGGPRMLERGFDTWWPQEKLAVRGYVEVLRHYREIVGIRAQLKTRLLADRPDLFIGVDAPDFNLALEAGLKAQGIRTVHFICPSIWAWRAGRVNTIRRSTDHVLCIFPFEPALLAAAGVAATYVGHPLAAVIPMEADKAAARRALALQGDEPVIALLPGSRASEVQHLARRFFDAAVLVQRERPGIRFLAPASPGRRAAIDAAAQESGLRNVTVLDGQSHTALAACDATLIASGTATLEAALYKRPMVIAYAMNRLSWLLLRPRQLQPWVGLPNILCGEFVVPELLQDDATPARLARELLDWLDSPARITAVQQRFHALHRDLRRNTQALATDAIEKVLES